MIDWHSWLFQRLPPRGTSRRRGRPQRHKTQVERLETRLSPAVMAPVAHDDFGTVAVGFDPNGGKDALAIVDVQENDVVAGSGNYPASLTLATEPSQGRVVFSRSFIDLHGKQVFEVASEYSYLKMFFRPDAIDENSSPVGNGFASARSGTVGAGGSLVFHVGVSNYSFGGPDMGDYDLFVRLGTSDFSNFDANRFDFKLRGSPFSSGASQDFRIPHLTPGTPFIAWIDNMVGPGTYYPDTSLGLYGQTFLYYAPNPGFRGTDEFRYTLWSDDGSQSSTAKVTITVPNLPFVATNDSFVIPKNTPTVVDVFSNDHDFGGSLALDSLNLSARPAHGTATIEQSEVGKVFLYTPDVGFEGQDFFSYVGRSEDGDESNVAEVILSVGNQRPIAENDSITIKRNTAVAIEVLANDIDPDGSLDLTVSAVNTPPSHGTTTVEQTETGSVIRYTPAPDYLGEDHFTYTIRDDAGAVSNTAQVNVVIEANRPPLNRGGGVSVQKNTSTVIPRYTILIIDDGPIDWASLVVTASPQHGILLFRESNDFPGEYEFVYDPFPGFLGQDHFELTVRDVEGEVSNVGRVSIEVYDIVTLSPVPLDDAATTTENNPVAIAVLDNDLEYDLPLNREFVEITSAPQRGSVRVTQGETGPVIIYTPDARAAADTLVVDDLRDIDDGHYGAGHLSLREAITLANADRYTESFRYQARDITGAITSEATVTVDVHPTPTVITFSPQISQQNHSTIELTEVGDVSEGNTAILITSPISILGPTNGTGITLAGRGPSADLRLLLVAAGADLTLQNVTLTRGATDGSGGALLVQLGATATLINCSLISNSAYERGGAIDSWGDLTISDSLLSQNRATQGGGLYVVTGATTIGETVFKSNTASERGGAFFNASSDLDLTHVQLTNNSAHEGGGFYNAGRAMLTDCLISDNSADSGGGFENRYTATNVQLLGPAADGTVTLMGTHISRNLARRGGGFLNSGAAFLENTSLVGNQAEQGGAIFATGQLFPYHIEVEHRSASISLVSTTVSDNHAREGGGVYHEQGTADVTNSTFAHNTATQHGGGFVNDGELHLTNATLTDNSAPRGAGLFNSRGRANIVSSTLAANIGAQGAGLFNDLGIVTLTSSLIAGNLHQGQPNDIAGRTPVVASHSNFNLIGLGGSGGLTPGVGNNLVGVAPLLGALGHYGGIVETMPLLPGSPAIDMGGGTPADARGVERVGQRDIGAFESRGFQIIVASGSGQNARRDQTFIWPLRVTIRANQADEPVVGGVVRFTAPRSGPSARLSATQAEIRPNNFAYVTAQTNNIAGSYEVVATTRGAQESATFALRNRGNTKTDPQAPTPQTTNVDLTPISDNSESTPPTPSNESVLAAEPPAYTTLPADQAAYRLDLHGQLLRRLPGDPWKELKDNVVKFEKAPNGDVYALTDDHELHRFQLNSHWTTLHGGVTTFFMDAFGTLFILDSMNRMYMHWTFDRYYVLPATLEGSELHALDPPSDREVVQAAGISFGDDPLIPYDEANDVQYFPGGPYFPLPLELNEILRQTDSTADYEFFPPNLPSRAQHRSPFNNVRIVKELTADYPDSPRFYSEVGWAQLHHVTYKCTIYATTIRENGIVIGEDEQYVIYISHDHLHRYEPEVALPTVSDVLDDNILSFVVATAISRSEGAMMAAALPTRGHGSIVTVPGPAVQRREDNFIQSLTMSADGTLYQLGEPGDGWSSTGSENGPYFLWRLPSNALWQPIDYVYSYAVAPDNTLYILNRRHELLSLAATSNQWTTLATNIRSFEMTPAGTLFALGHDHNLRRFSHRKAQWKTIERDVQSLAMTEKGRMFVLTERHQLKTLLGPTVLITIDRGVASFAMTDDGAVYELNGRGQLKRITHPLDHRILATGIRAFEVTPEGVPLALTEQGVLQQLTARDHWLTIQTNVRKFQTAPNGDLYVINDRQELLRRKLGYFWQNLQKEVTTFTIYSDGVVHATAFDGVKTLYASLGTNFVLGPVPDASPGASFDAPADMDVIMAANFLSGTIDIQFFFAHTEFPLSREAASIGFPETSPNSSTSLLSLTHTRSRLRFNSVTLPIPDLIAVARVTLEKELILDEVDVPKFVPNIGLARAHHALYRCILYYDTPLKSNNQLVVYIDHDHLHFR